MDEVDALFRSAETDLEHGNGLGLWLVYWAVQQSDGELSFSETEAGGTVVELLFPAAD